MTRTRRLPRGLEILYEDDDIIAVNKPAGLLTVGTQTNKTQTAYYILTDYVRKGCYKSRNRIFIVHRLDQYTSGVVVFAKNERAKMALQDNWRQTQKKYIAVVHGRLAEKEGTITSYLTENRAYVVYSVKDPDKGKLAQTAYKVIKEGKDTSLLEIDLLTGRKNQIRVHMAYLGHPVAGDKVYGPQLPALAEGRFAGWQKAPGPLAPGIVALLLRQALHSRRLAISHPASGARQEFQAAIPDDIRRLIEAVRLYEVKAG